MSAALNGAHALVTGGGRGIGAAIATALARRRRAAHAARPRPRGARGARRDAAGRARSVRRGRRRRATTRRVGAAFAAARARHGEVAILVNNAGDRGQRRRSPKLDRATWDAMIAVNLTAHVHVHARSSSPADDRGAARPDRQRRQHRGTGRRPVHRGLQRGQARRDRADPLARGGARRARGSPSTPSVPGFTETAMLDARSTGSRGDRPQRGRRRGRAARAQPAGPLRAARRGRRRSWRGCAGRTSAAVNGQAIVIDGGEVRDDATVDTESRATRRRSPLDPRLAAAAGLHEPGREAASAAKLRDAFDTTLPRFDFLSQLERSPDGLRMTEISQRMMVTGGNITRIADQLLAEGLITRTTAPGDRRAAIVQLTAARTARVRRDGATVTRLGRRHVRRPRRSRARAAVRAARQAQASPQPGESDAPAMNRTTVVCRLRRRGTFAGRSTTASRRSRSTGRSARTRSRSTRTPSCATCSAAWRTRTTSTRSCSPAPAATSAPAATCTRSSGR